jgi:hypothetical protein
VTGGNVFNIAGDFNLLPQKSIDKPVLQIDWLDRSRQLLAAQKHLTTNRLLNKSNRSLDDIHVPLGLIERKERPKVKEEPSPEQGSQLYQTEYTETKRFEHEAFLADVVGKPAGGKHIAIIGEPGAGKTTILTKIGAWLIGQAEQQPPAPLVVAWISLADIGDRSLEKYLKKKWLKKVCEDNLKAAWEDWKGLRQQGRVWLLLDGLDEMSGDALAAIHRDLGLAWAQNLRVVMTCRINQWETAAGGNVLTNSFDVYRTLDYSYQTSQGEDQVKEFISKWFADDEKVATQIRTELDAPGKERIKDLVKNPLRLTLLCASWEKDNQALPETQADLYRGFVNYLYNWKAAEFSDEVKLRQELDLALGKLAKAGLNRQPINDGAVRRFRFTASEISELWVDLPDTLLPAAKNLGWLNVVGEESGEAVYAFYHPTFQEYFAAFSIDDWDYFLPRAHIDQHVNCRGENKPTYRVFEQEWRQVILLWIGRSDKVVTEELKEEFIDKLTDFREQEGYFYYCRAYCMAAICAGEFRSLRRAEAIVQQIVKWAFGYFNTEKQEWRMYLDPLSSLATEIIPFTHRGYAIADLIHLLTDENSDRNFNVAKVLGKIAVGHEKTIATLIDLLSEPNINERLRSDIVEILSQIAVGHEKTIATLIDLLSEPKFNERQRSNIAKALSQIAVGHEKTIATLIDLLREPNLDRMLRSNIADALGEIAVEDRIAIDALILLLSNFEDSVLHYCVAKIFDKIAVGDSAAIDALISFLGNPALEDETLRYWAAWTLGRIDLGNRTAIDTLISLLNPAFLNSLNSNIADDLIRIAVGDRTAIDALISLLGSPAIYFNASCRINYALREIAVKDRTAIDALISLLAKPALECWLLDNIADTLGKIAVGDRATIDYLIPLFEDSTLGAEVRSRAAETLDKIAPGNRRATIDGLISLLDNSTLEDTVRYKIMRTLEKIAVGDRIAIDALILLLSHPALEYWLIRNIVDTLGKIAVGDRIAIDALILLLKTALEDTVFTSVIEALGKIAVRDGAAIDALISLLPNPTLEHRLLSCISGNLNKVAPGTREAIDALISRFYDKDLHNNSWEREAAVDLGKILTAETMPLVIWQLKNNVTDEVYRSNFKLFDACFKILFQCAQTLSYPKLHAAWHQTHLPTRPFSPQSKRT